MFGFRVALLCHIPNFRCLCQSVLSLGVFAKLLGVEWGGAGGDAQNSDGMYIIYNIHRTEMRRFLLKRTFCQLGTLYSVPLLRCDWMMDDRQCKLRPYSGNCDTTLNMRGFSILNC